MLEENGRVLEIRGDSAVVEISRHAACDGCGAQTACGTGLLSHLFRPKQSHFVVKRTPNLEVGNEVVIAIPESSIMLKGAFFVYVLPLLGMFVFALLADAAFAPASEGAIIIAGATGLILMLVWVRVRYRYSHSDTRFQPVIVRRNLSVRVTT